MKKLFMLFLALGAAHTQAENKQKTIVVKNSTTHPIDFTIGCETKKEIKKLPAGKKLEFRINCVPIKATLKVHFTGDVLGPDGATGVYDIGLEGKGQADSLSFEINDYNGIIDIKIN